MGCDFPLKGYRSARQRGPSGKPLITFKPNEAMNTLEPLEIPCGNCMGCKLEKSRQWAVRMMHEAHFHGQNSFLTLTYSDEACPADYGLDLRHLQLFMKRLRRSLAHKIRFYACGEYGDKTGRPHYHAIIFGWDPPDQTFHSMSERGDKQYRSAALDRHWDHGIATTGKVTMESCRYVAAYVTKKIKTNDDFGLGRYWRVSPVTGELHKVRPEFSVMSRRPGLGQAYVDKYKSDFFPSGFIVMDGIKQAVPRFYKSKLTEEEQRRLKLGAKRPPRAIRLAEATMERRRARAAVRDERIRKLQRNL